MDGEAREIQLDGVNRQRLFRSNMKTKSADLRGKRKERKRKGERESKETKVKLSVQLKTGSLLSPLDLREGPRSFLLSAGSRRRTADGQQCC